MDSSTSHSYASSKAINLIKAESKEYEFAPNRHACRRRNQNYASLRSCHAFCDWRFHTKRICHENRKRELLTLDNPRYSDLLNNHLHLRGVTMEDSDTKVHLPMHVIIGANDFAKISRYRPVIVDGSDEEGIS